MKIVLLALILLTSCCCGHIRRRSIDLHDGLGHQNDFYLPRTVVPKSYRLHLVPHIDEGYFTGQVWINVTCIESTDSITLHAHESLNTSSNQVSVTHLPQDITSAEVKKISVNSTKKNFAKQWYMLMLAEKLNKASDYELYITFSGKLNDATSEALFRASYMDSRSDDKSWYVGTGMETTKARQVFPCFDEPALKATFQLSVAARRKYHVWSNVPLKDTDNMSEQPGWLWHHFPTTPAMSTFSVGVFISDFNYVTSKMPSGGYIRLSARPELLDSLQKVNIISQKAFNFAEEYLNFSYPLEKLDMIVLPGNSSDFSSDSWGFVIIRESDLDEDCSNAVSNSMLTQWLGHLTTPYWWDNIAVYTALITHLTTQFKLQKLNMTTSVSDYPLYNIYSSSNNLASSVTGHEYTDRAVRLLRLLNYSLTEDTFRQALHMFLEDRQFKTFTDNDLWIALTRQGRQDESLAEDIKIEDVAKSWLGKEHYPVVTITRNYEKNTAAIEQHVFLRERPHNIFGKDRMLWYIPIMYVTASNMNITDIRPVAWLKNDKQLTIDNLPGADEFVIVNPDGIGSFIVNYDTTNWGLLSAALQEGTIPTLTRVKILHDAWNLAYSGELDFDIALNITFFIKQERTLKVWQTFFVMVDQLRTYLGGTEVETLFDMYARSLVEHCLQMLGPVKLDDDEDTRKLRETAQVFQYILSEQMYNTSVDQMYTSWMESSDPYEYTRNNKVPFETILRWGSLEQYQSVLQYAVKLLDGHLEEAKKMFIKLARSAPQQLDKVDSLLKQLLMDDVLSKNSYIPRICLSQLAGFYNGSVAALHFVQENWQDIRQRLEYNPELWKSLISTATARLATQDDLDMFSEFYVERRGHFGNAELLVEKELERMKEDAEWMKNNVPVIHRWLEDFLDKPVSELQQ